MVNTDALFGTPGDKKDSKKYTLQKIISIECGNGHTLYTLKYDPGVEVRRESVNRFAPRFARICINENQILFNIFFKTFFVCLQVC